MDLYSWQQNQIPNFSILIEIVASSKESFFTEYLEHNGESFSKSVLKDKIRNFEINNIFYKETINEKQQKWHSITSRERGDIGGLNNKLSLVYYFLIENFDEQEDLRFLQYDEKEGIIKVMHPEQKNPLEHFRIMVYNKENKRVEFSDVQKYIFTDNTEKRDTWSIKSIIERNMQVDPEVRFKVLPNNHNQASDKTSLVAVQLVLEQYGSFNIHVSHNTNIDSKEAVDYFT